MRRLLMAAAVAVTIGVAVVRAESIVQILDVGGVSPEWHGVTVYSGAQQVGYACIADLSVYPVSSGHYHVPNSVFGMSASQTYTSVDDAGEFSC